MAELPASDKGELQAVGLWWDATRKLKRTAASAEG